MIMFNVNDKIKILKESFREKMGKIVKVLNANNSFTGEEEQVYLVKFKDNSIQPIDEKHIEMLNV